MNRCYCAAVLSILLVGCNGATDPANVAGFYVLTTVDSLAVPRLMNATNTCDELVLRGGLRLATNSSFDLSITQLQDCTRAGGTADTFTAVTSGDFSVDHTNLILHPAGTTVGLSGMAPGGAIQLQLPQLPLIAGSHSGTFVVFPQ
ncbi:MAG TPA: hypothetical protein VFP39_11400 [Gemmatimonadales bacterium]|nr:hypothetical protein [Gemmatimonadales bacterium]